MKSLPRKVKVVAPLAAVLVVAGCGMGGDKATEPYQDAPRSGLDNSPALIGTMPDGFSNFATKCIGDVRVTVVYHGDSSYGAVSTVVDPQCR